MGSATASRGHTAKLKVVPYKGGDTWELHWEGERNGKASFAGELREALARAESMGMVPRRIVSDSHLWAQRPSQTVEKVFRRVLAQYDPVIKVEDARTIGGLGGAVINLVYWAKYSGSRDSEPGAASRRVVIEFPHPRDQPIPKQTS